MISLMGHCGIKVLVSFKSIKKTSNPKLLSRGVTLYIWIKCMLSCQYFDSV